MKKILIILLFIASPLQAEKIEKLSWYNLQELLEDDKLTYKIIKSCVSLNSAVTELIKGLTNDYMDFMMQNGVANQSFIKGTFLGDDLAFCNEIRSAIEVTILESKKQE